MIPKLFCLGAAKSGTTTLADILKEHPEIYIPDIKETHFFDYYFDKGLEWYINRFYTQRKKEIWAADFTPAYLFMEDIPEKISQTIGKDAKFLVILRNPAKRAYSHFLMSTRKGHETLSFSKALQKEGERIQRDYLSKMRFSYISRGYYYDQISRYFKLFDRSNFHVVIFEEFINNPEEETKKVLRFLGVDENFSLDYNVKSNQKYSIRSRVLQRVISIATDFFSRIHFKPRFLVKTRTTLININKGITNKEEVEPDFIQINQVYFKEDIEKLSELLGKDLLTIWPRD
ncbi:sulfotransferase [Mycoplasmatota bacterium zrk1]